MALGVLAVLVAACTKSAGPSAHPSTQQASPIPSGTSGPGLVVRTSVRQDAWSVQVPSTWQHAGACPGQSGLCSTQGGDTDTDVWFDPANVGRRITVVTCRGGGCAAKNRNGTPVFPPRVSGTVSTQVLAPSRVAYTLGQGPHPEGPYRIDGLAVATLSGGSASFPLFTVTTSLPDSVHWLANDILNSFAPGPVPPPAGPAQPSGSAGR